MFVTMHLNILTCLCCDLFISQSCSKSSAGVAAHPGTDLAVWSLGAFLHCHGLHLHPAQLPTGKECFTHTQNHFKYIKKIIYLIKVSHQFNQYVSCRMMSVMMYTSMTRDIQQM